MNSRINGVIGATGSPILANLLGFIQINTILETIVLAFLGAVVGFITTWILKRIFRKRTRQLAEREERILEKEFMLEQWEGALKQKEEALNK